jgi:hypothetical protein
MLPESAHEKSALKLRSMWRPLVAMLVNTALSPRKTGSPDA